MAGYAVPMTYEDFLDAVLKRYEEVEGEIRFGQLYFNTLHGCRPDIAAAIRGTEFDPFHREGVKPETVDRVKSLWDGLPDTGAAKDS